MATEIVVYHVGGGSDEIGPIERVREAGFPLNLITFEALDGQCIDDRVGEAEFYINKHPLSSGLLKPNPRYARETYDHTQIAWGANTELDRVVPVRTTTLNILARDLPQADVISIDTQGAELRILRGANDVLHGALCVVAEVEFVPIYLGQPLYGDQAEYLAPFGFRLMDLCSVQHWYQGPKFGLGFMTVAEAVWLRFDYESLARDRVEKLAMIAAGFGRMSYVMVLLEHINGEVENPMLQALWTHRNNPELRAA